MYISIFIHICLFHTTRELCSAKKKKNTSSSSRSVLPNPRGSVLTPDGCVQWICSLTASNAGDVLWVLKIEPREAHSLLHQQQPNKVYSWSHGGAFAWYSSNAITSAFTEHIPRDVQDTTCDKSQICTRVCNSHDEMESYQWPYKSSFILCKGGPTYGGCHFVIAWSA